MKQDSKAGVSVIIPVYNQAESLKVTLRHFAHQSYPLSDYEVIVVDDGSDDGLKQQVHSGDWPRMPDNIRYLHQENKGRSEARNNGVALASGRLLIFCDADRVPHENFIALHAGIHKDSERLAVIGCPWDYFGRLDALDTVPGTRWSDIQKFSRKPLFYSKVMKLYDREGNTASSIDWATFLVGNSSVKREDFERAGGFDPDFKTWGFEHFELAMRLKNCGVSFRSCPQAANYHIPHSRGSGYYQTMIESSLELLKSKHRNYKCELLGDFLCGRISLQDFETGFGGTLTEELKAEKPVFNIIK